MRLLLVDGHYYAYRSFFAIQGLKNSQGDPTNAVFGFVKALRKMLADVKPDLAGVVWDAGLPERRMELLPSYKQQRDETPGDLEVQFSVIEEAVAALGLHNLSLKGHEADDLIASYAAEARKENAEIVIATNDKDIYSLVDAGTRIYSTNKSDVGEKKEGFSLLGAAEVEAKWGVPPERIPDVLALTGDSVDNIPGVEGVGPKTAAKLVLEHGTIAAMLGQTAQIKNEKLRAKIEAAAQRVRDNMELVRLDENLPLAVPLKNLHVTPDAEAVLAVAKKCEFRSLVTEYEKLAKEKARGSQGELF